MPPDQPQGTPAPPGQGESDAPKYVTEEQLNRAITSRFNEFHKKIEKGLETALGGVTAKLEELTKQPPPGMPPGQGSGDGARTIEDHPIVKGLQKQLGDLTKNLETAKAERDAEKQTTREIALRQKVGEALTAGGVDPKFVKQAVGYLVDAEKRVRFAEDSDELVFRDGTTDFDFGTGVKTWLKGDEAKIYMPARGTQGSGDRGHGKQTPNGPQQPPSVGRALLGMASQVVATGGRSTD